MVERPGGGRRGRHFRRTAREVDRERLARERDAILHARRADRLLPDAEVRLEHLHEFGVGETLLLDADVEMLTFTARLVERHLVDDEVVVTKLDATRKRVDVEHASPGHRITEDSGRGLGSDMERRLVAGPRVTLGRIRTATRHH